MAGFRFQCRDCGKITGFMTGMDYSYTRTYRTARKKALAGGYGQEIRAFLEEHPAAALDPEDQLYICPECGEWKVEPSLDLHLPDAPRNKPEDFVIFEEDTGRARGYTPALTHTHRCTCGAAMRRAPAPASETLRCPACGGSMVIDVEMGSEQ